MQHGCLVVMLKDDITWLLVGDVEVEDADGSEGGQGGGPVDQEHHGHAQHRPEQRHPRVVILEWSRRLTHLRGQFVGLSCHLNSSWIDQRLLKKTVLVFRTGML